MNKERCPDCGALLVYDKNKFAYVCNFCGREFVSEKTHMAELRAEDMRIKSGEFENRIREEQSAKNLIDNLEASLFATNRLRKIFRALSAVFAALAVTPAILFVCGMIVSADGHASEIVANMVAGFAFGEILFIPATVTFLVLSFRCKRKSGELGRRPASVKDIRKT